MSEPFWLIFAFGGGFVFGLWAGQVLIPWLVDRLHDLRHAR